MRCNNNLLNFLIGIIVLLTMGAIPAGSQTESQPHVIVIGVNGMEWDIIRPLLLKGELPNFAALIQRRSAHHPSRHHGFRRRGKDCQHRDAPAGTSVVDSVRAWRDGRHGQRACDVPGHAVKRLHDQWHAYPWQRLRGRDLMFTEAVGGERGSGGISAEPGG